MTRVNLARNPSFRFGTSGWEAIGGATIEVTDDYGFFGVRSLQINRSDIVGTGVRNSDPYPVQAGLPYSASIYVYIPITVPATESAPLQLTITWLDGTGTEISQSSSVVITKTPSSSWSRLTLSVAQAPAGSSFAYISLSQVVSGTAGEPFYIDAILFEQSSFVGEYIDNLTQAEENTFVNRSLTKVPFPQITGMELNADISLGSLILNTIDEDGVVWVCTNITGWWEQPNAEVPDITRGTEDGSYQVNGRYTARFLTLEGVFLPQNKTQIASARDKLTAASNLVRRGEWLRANEGPTRAAFVRLTGQPRMETVNPRGRTEFSISLVAPDPIKYQWNDNDPENGLFEVTSPASTPLQIENIGTAEVKCVLAVRGPLGAGSTIENASNGNLLTFSEPLRGRGPVGKITQIQRFQNVATATTEKAHGLIPGDRVEVYNVISAFNSNETTPFFTVLSSTSEEPYQFTYSSPGNDISEINVAGVVALIEEDVVEIDTYAQSVKFNQDETGERFRLAPLVDWIALIPGDNTLVLTEDHDPFQVQSKSYDSATGIATLTLDRAHFIRADGEKTIDVFLPTTAEVVAKEIDAQVATLTTTAPHGFAVGDIIDVALVETIDIISKEVDTDVATIITDGNHGIDEGETFTVNMATEATVITKQRTSNTVTLRTASDHRFSEGDLVEVDLPTEAEIARKLLFANIATLTTSTTHNFSVGDTIDVSLPESATIVEKTILGSTVTLRSSSAHGFSLQDKITVDFSETADITDFEFDGLTSYSVTLTTSAPHGFSVGDRIEVDITDVGVDVQFNGTWVIDAIPSSTQIKYLYYEDEEAVEPVELTGTGTVTNLTNQEINGLVTVESIPSSTTFSYARVA